MPPSPLTLGFKNDTKNYVGAWVSVNFDADEYKDSFDLLAYGDCGCNASASSQLSISRGLASSHEKPARPKCP